MLLNTVKLPPFANFGSHTFCTGQIKRNMFHKNTTSYEQDSIDGMQKYDVERVTPYLTRQCK